MQITVVIATHNRPALLREAIASIGAQSFREWEIVVVDDGSQPPVELESLSDKDVERIRLLRHEVPHGPSEARNTGMRAATGNLVAFLDDDDLFKPDALKKIDSAFQNEAGLDCLFFNVELFGARAEGTRYNQDQALSQLFYKMDLPLPANDGSIVQLDSEALFIALLDHLPMAFQRVVIKRNMLEKVGLYRGRGLRIWSGITGSFFTANVPFRLSLFIWFVVRGRAISAASRPRNVSRIQLSAFARGCLTWKSLCQVKTAPIGGSLPCESQFQQSLLRTRKWTVISMVKFF